MGSYSFPFSDSKLIYRYLSNGRSNPKKIKKKRCIFLKFCFWEDPPHSVNWSPTHSTGPQTPFFTDSSVSVAQIQKNQKIRCIFFRILLLGGPTPPSQHVPNPFNWSPNILFYRYLG